MIGVALNLVCDSCDTMRRISKTAFFVDRSKTGKVIWLLISSTGTFGWPSVLRFLEVVFVVTMSSLGIVDRVEISSLFSSRFIKAWTTRALATCCNVNAVLMYLMKPILASRCVLKCAVLSKSCLSIVWS